MCWITCLASWIWSNIRNWELIWRFAKNFIKLQRREDKEDKVKCKTNIIKIYIEVKGILTSNLVRDAILLGFEFIISGKNWIIYRERYSNEIGDDSIGVKMNLNHKIKEKLSKMSFEFANFW